MSTKSIMTKIDKELQEYMRVSEEVEALYLEFGKFRQMNRMTGVLRSLYREAPTALIGATVEKYLGNYTRLNIKGKNGNRLSVVVTMKGNTFITTHKDSNGRAMFSDSTSRMDLIGHYSMDSLEQALLRMTTNNRKFKLLEYDKEGNKKSCGMCFGCTCSK
jgi:hypothetical protein